jgi:predicted exporter
MNMRDVRDLPQPRSARQTWGVRAAWLLLALIAALYCVWRFAGPSPLQTNLLALLPATEADPVAEKAVDTLASALGDRTVFLVSSNDDAHAKAAAKELGASLQKSGAFASVTAELPPFDLAQIAALYMPYRFGLLAAGDRVALAGSAANAGAMGAADATSGSNTTNTTNATHSTLRDTLTQRLYSPLRGGLTTSLADDPFGWLERWLTGLPLATSNLEVEDNLLVAHRGAATSVLIVATLPGSAYETKTQRAVRTALAQSESALRDAFPDVSVARTGAVFYAESARSASEREVHLIGVASLCGIALLMMWVFRSPRLLLLGFVSTALGIVCALAATLLVFGQLHLLTLVFGASLIGEAVDYSIQYFVVYLGAGRDWDARHGARTVRPALTVALLTSLLGYAILMWVPFPALKQIACFAMVGIATAFASVLSLLPTLLTRPPKRSPQRVFAGAARLLTLWHRAIGGRRAWYVAALLLIVAIPGWLRLTSDDDIHLLIQRDPSLVAQEDKVRDAVGVDNSAQFFVVRGETPEAVLQRAEALGAKLDALNGTRDQVGGYQSVAQFVPSAKRQSDDRALLAQHVFDDPAALRATLLQAGFKDEVADAWLAAFARSQTQAHSQAPLTVERWLAAPWSQPYRHLWLGEVSAGGPAAKTYAAVVIPQGVTPHNAPALIALAQRVPGVVFVDKAASVSKLFGEYRVDSGWWLGGALALVLILLTVRYGPREACLDGASNEVTAADAARKAAPEDASQRAPSWDAQRDPRLDTAQQKASAIVARNKAPLPPTPQTVSLANRLRGGIATTLPVLLAVGVTLAAFGYAGVPLNLFNWLALMLVLGVGANYAVFLREGCLRADADLGAVWTGVLLSAATTLLSFGMLGMSAMPALKSFGATLALGIAVAVLLAPIGMPSESRRAA